MRDDRRLMAGGLQEPNAAGSGWTDWSGEGGGAPGNITQTNQMSLNALLRIKVTGKLKGGRLT